MAVSGRLEEIALWVETLLWSNLALQEVDRLPPYIGPLVQEEVEIYAGKAGQTMITLALYREARNRGKVNWTSAAEGRLTRIPSSIRSMAKVEIERMAIERGLSEVTEALMDEAKAKFLGMRG
jgi:hypothetical protein